MNANVLYFVDGEVTDQDHKAAKAVGARIRNAQAYHPGDFLEQCDGVLGCAPDAYVEAFGKYTAGKSLPVDKAPLTEEEVAALAEAKRIEEEKKKQIEKEKADKATEKAKKDAEKALADKDKADKLAAAKAAKDAAALAKGK